MQLLAVKNKRVIKIHKLLAKHNENDQVKQDEMDRACSTNGGEEECI
jgi:hypothetical protein